MAKWIKYQYYCNSDKGILLNKKIEYSAHNLTIAKKEAYNGKYTIEEDNKVLEKEPLPINLGGTGAKTKEKAWETLGLFKPIYLHLSDVEFISKDSGKVVYTIPDLNSEEYILMVGKLLQEPGHSSAIGWVPAEFDEWITIQHSENYSEEIIVKSSGQIAIDTNRTYLVDRDIHLLLLPAIKLKG